MFDLFKKLTEEKSSKAKDPVCGMSVNLLKTEFKSIIGGKTYGFCSVGCKNSFDNNPNYYID